MWDSEEGSAVVVIQNQRALLSTTGTNSMDTNEKIGISRDTSISRFTVAKVPTIDITHSLSSTQNPCSTGQNEPASNGNSSDGTKSKKAPIASLVEDTTSPPQSTRSVTSVKQVQFTVGDENMAETTATDESRSASCGTQEAFSFRNIETVERLPCIDHYRNMLSVAKAMSSRPTLAELHEGTNAEMDMPEEPHDEVKEELQRLPKASSSGSNTGSSKIGWIQGVLIRCVLCIIGVMLYLRLSWVAGQAGIILGIAVVLLASTVTTLTALSLCAIATNGEVKGGGAYFLISRSLGPEFGGSIGVIFSFANAVAAAMYVVGFAESVRDVMKEHGTWIADGSVNDVRIVALCTIVLLLGIVIVGVQFETKAQVVLLGILCISLCSFILGTFIPPTEKKKAVGVTGYSWQTASSNIFPSWRGQDFFSVFSVYFPAATGIMAGANISGDLMDPQKAIPKGTLLAIAITSFIYVTVVIITGSTCLREASGNMDEYVLMGNVSSCTLYDNCTHGLLHSSQVLEQASVWGPLVTAGVFAATLSSALASMVSAPKVFQALCKDKLFPYIGHFARGYGRAEEPRLAYLLAFTIAVCIILIGKLNAIAPIISNFFLASYALINYACFDASFAKSPGFRPAFKYYNMWLSLFGSVVCVGVMFLINWWAALVTSALVLALYVYLLRRKPDVNWGSSSQAHAYRNALNSMLRLAHTEEHVKNYRPQILLLTGNPAARQVLLEFASNITKETSLLICGHVVVHPQPAKTYPTLQKLHVYVSHWLHKHKFRSFYLPVASETLDQGAVQLIQLAGMGKLRPNIVFLGFKNDWRTCPVDHITRYVNIIHHAFDCCYGVGVLRLPSGCDMTEQLKSLASTDGGSCYLTVTGAADAHQSHLASGGDSGSEFNSPQHNVTSKMLNAASFPNFASNYQICTVSDTITGAFKPNSALTPSALPASTLGLGQTHSSDTVRKISGNSDDGQRLIWASINAQQNLFAVKNPKLQSYTEQFRKRVKKPVIDVWWLFDDGGLTLLIPHLLTLHKSYLEGAKLRMFTIASSHQLEQEQRSMAALLNKFRIDYSDVYVIPDVGKKPKGESLKEFEALIEPFRETNLNVDGQKEGMISDAELAAQKEKTHRMIRIRELLLKHSTAATLIVLTLPIPRRGMTSSPLYMAWLETITRGLPPVLLLRGNQQSVLTFYS